MSTIIPNDTGLIGAKVCFQALCVNLTKVCAELSPALQLTISS